MRSCEGITIGGGGAREPVPIPSQRRKGSFMLRVRARVILLLLNRTSLAKSLLEAQMILQNRFVCDRLLGIVTYFSGLSSS